jgi:hypothetical protein
MVTRRRPDPRPDVEAALRGRDPSVGMDGEANLETSTLAEAIFWTQVYDEILAMEEKLLIRIHELMASQQEAARRETQLTNVPVIAAQAARFRARFSYWSARLAELNGEKLA